MPRDSAVSDEMVRLMRESVAPGDGLLPVRGMSPHYMSRKSDLATDALVYLFPVEMDDEDWHVYLRER